MSERIEGVDFALAAYREEGQWQVEELAHDVLVDVPTLAHALRRFPGDGGAIGLVTAYQKPLLAGVEKPVPHVAQQQNVVRQWYMARLYGTPEAWQSVIDYFPTQTYWVNHAKQQLALIHLREDHWDRALEIFKELASLDESETELRAFGLAGEAAVLTKKGEYTKSAHVIDQLQPIVNKLDPLMRQFLSYALRTNKSKLGVPTPAQWQEWLKQHFPDGG